MHRGLNRIAADEGEQEDDLYGVNYKASRMLAMQYEFHVGGLPLRHFNHLSY
jgi:hypothetical protein